MSLIIVHKSKPYEWTPEDFNFNCVRASTIAEENLWRNGRYELRYLGNGFWLCRKHQTKGTETKVVVNFCKSVLPEDVEFAKMLLKDRL